MKRFRNSTAMLACAALVAPHVALAAQHTSLDICDDKPKAPCIIEAEGLEVEAFVAIKARGEKRDLAECPADLATLDEDATPCLYDKNLMIVARDSEEAEEALAEMGEAAAGDDTDTALEGEGTIETEGQSLAGDDAVEEAIEGTEPVEESAEMEVDTPAEAAEASDEPVASAPVEGTGPVDGDDPVGDDETVADNAVEASDEPVGDAETDSVTEAADEAVGTDGNDVPAETAAEGATAMEGDAAQGADAGTGGGQAAATTAADAQTPQGGTETTAGADAAAGQDEVVVEDTPAPAAAAAADSSAEAAAEVEVEQVTEENSRSADEDFETSAAGEQNAQAAATSGGSDRDGLSNFEKALLLGLGAAVVGQALNNGDQVVSNSGDRVVVRTDNGDLRVLKDDDALLRQPGSEVRTESFADGSTRTVVTRDDGTRIVTIRAADGRVVRRTRVFEDGSQIVLFDDTETAEPVRVSELPQVEQQTIDLAGADEEALAAALARAEARDVGRRFSLRQVRQIKEVRALAPMIELTAITFPTGSAAIQPSQADELRTLGRAMKRLIDERPGEVFLIEGHTDTVGDASYNLALSDRRAETVALALTEYFDVPPENLITQGYGESQLKIEREGDIRENRRAVVRRITNLLTSN